MYILVSTVSQINHHKSSVDIMGSKSAHHFHSFTAQNRVFPEKYQTVQCRVDSEDSAGPDIKQQDFSVV